MSGGVPQIRGDLSHLLAIPKNAVHCSSVSWAWCFLQKLSVLEIL